MERRSGKRSDRTICLGSTFLPQVFYSYPEQTLSNLRRAAALEKPHVDKCRLSLQRQINKISRTIVDVLCFFLIYWCDCMVLKSFSIISKVHIRQSNH